MIQVITNCYRYPFYLIFCKQRDTLTYIGGENIYMRINAISGSNSAYCVNKPRNFKGLIKDKSVESIINNMSEKDILELKKLEKRIANTKFWDMKISKIENMIEELKFEFIDKKKLHGSITDGIFPYDKKGNAIKIYSIIYGPENISRNLVESLRYKSSSRATAVYNKYMKNLEFVKMRNGNLTPIEKIKSKEIELNMLEESSHFIDESDKLKYINTEMTTKDRIGNSLDENI